MRETETKLEAEIEALKRQWREMTNSAADLRQEFGEVPTSLAAALYRVKDRLGKAEAKLAEVRHPSEHKRARGY